MAFVDVLRGGLLESRHRVHVAVCDDAGRVLASCGDARFVSFMRSSAKPFQALGVAARLDDLGLHDAHLAVVCGSHGGSDEHVAVVEDLQRRTGLNPSLLRCGTHPPFDVETRNTLRARQEKPNVLRHNCSGKHSGMLAVARFEGNTLEDYTDPAHPVQQTILQDLRALTQHDEIGVAVDGCSVPSYALPLAATARACALLANPKNAPDHLVAPLERVSNAMRTHPHLVAGHGSKTQTFMDTWLMQRVPGLVSKVGAEGYQILAVQHPTKGALGVALKIEDGTERARDVAVLEVLRQLGVLDANGPEVATRLVAPLRNNAGLLVGELRARFVLA